MVYTLVDRGLRLSEARAVLAKVAPLVALFADGRASFAYNEAQIAFPAAEIRAALEALSRARVDAAHIGNHKLVRLVDGYRAIVLIDLGRVAEAHALLEGIRAREGVTMAPCERADLDTNLGFSTLIAADAPYPSTSLGDPIPVLTEAEALHRGACADTALRTNALLNLAWARLQRRELDAARALVATAREIGAPLGPTDGEFALDLDGRIALGDDDPRAALVAYERLAAGRADTPLFFQSRAEEGRAQALSAIGDRVGALEAIARADALLDAASNAVPLGEGRGSFWWNRARVTQLKVRLLIDLGRAREALEAARIDRGKIVAGVQRAARLDALTGADRARWEAALAAYQRERDRLFEDAADDWSLPAQTLDEATKRRRARDIELRASLDAVARELSPIAAPDLAPTPSASGAMSIALVPLESGWAVVRARGDSVTAARIDAGRGTQPNDASLVTMLGLTEHALEGVDRVRLIPFGPLRDLDLHATKIDGTALDGTALDGTALDGTALVDRAAVEFEIAWSAEGHTNDEGPVLVVADPTESLEGARSEGLAVAPLFERRGTVETLVGARATRARVLTALRSASVFYFAGHGKFAGTDGFQSALPLAGAESIGVTDILALGRAPALVVLSGCQTGRDRVDAETAPGIGFADAFLAVGARAVVASTRTVDDATTRALMEAFARALQEAPSDVANALRRAQITLRRSNPRADWSAFRVFVR